MIRRRKGGWKTYLDASVPKHFSKLFEKMHNTKVICVYSIICFRATLENTCLCLPIICYISMSLFNNRGFIVFHSWKIDFS